MRSRCFRPIPPSAISAPSASSSFPPSARTSPAPPSLTPESPHPTRMRDTPASSASATSSPTPRVVVRQGSRCSRGTSFNPAAIAISTTATGTSPPSSARPASIRSPTGPVTRTSFTEPPVIRAMVCAVPSPPSASGNSTTSALGQARKTPWAIADATFSASRFSLNPDGAITMRMRGSDRRHHERSPTASTERRSSAAQMTFRRRDSAGRRIAWVPRSTSSSCFPAFCPRPTWRDQATFHISLKIRRIMMIVRHAKWGRRAARQLPNEHLVCIAVCDPGGRCGRVLRAARRSVDRVLFVIDPCA